MPLDTAIINIGEYYAAHYLESQFIKDIADPLKAWRDLGSRSVPRRLEGLGDTYFKAKSQALDHDIAMHRATADEPELATWHDTCCGLSAMNRPPTAPAFGREGCAARVRSSLALWKALAGSDGDAILFA